MSLDDRRLIIVSNRLPVRLSGSESDQIELVLSNGGLVRGLNVIHRDSNSIWVGHLAHELDPSSWLADCLNRGRLHNVSIDEDTYDRYYNGYANNTLWPLFHNFLSSMAISDDHWDAYVQANEAFVESIANIVQENDWVWIHDYQLMLVPSMLRKRFPDMKISYFHHIPFPSSEIFRTIPRREEILNGLLGADYIGFHTFDYARHFLATVKRILGVKTKLNDVILSDRSIHVATHPLGVDFEAFAREIRNPSDRVEKLGEKNEVVFLGIDRLDYTKGLPERLQSFARFLELYPEYVGKARLVQICVPSRQEIGSYHDIRQEVERLVGKINGEFSRPSYIPVEYLFRSIPLESIIDLYQQADVMVVTPLRDGLNLVCKEYIVARSDLDGCLVLSEFAGSAAELGEALQVNPYDIDSVAQTFHTALQMSALERRQRMICLRERMKKYDNVAWAHSYIQSWQNHDQASHIPSVPLKDKVEEALVSEVSQSKVFLFLDYDGTLAPIRTRPEQAVPDQALFELMERLKRSEHIIPAIVTGRPSDFCEQHLVEFGIPIASEHGAFIRYPEQGQWNSPITMSEDDINSLQAEILEVFEAYRELVPHSHVESKKTCMVWHYRESDPDFAESQAHILAETLEQLLNKTSWSVYHGKKTVEVRLSLAHKGFAVELMLKQMGFDENCSLISVGDDTTDEDMYRVQVEKNHSIHIGMRNAFSRYYLNSPQELYEFLLRLADRLEVEEKSIA